MPYAQEHLYLTWGGTAPGGEIWQTGCRWVCNEPISDPGNFTAFSLEDIADDVSAAWTSNSYGPSSDLLLRWVKAAWIGTDGAYQSEPRVHEFVTPVPGQDTTETLPTPLQVAVVVSLSSGQTLGKQNYGRMYWPAPAAGRLKNSAGWATAFPPAMATLMANTLVAINGELDTLPVTNWTLVIMGETGYKPVTQIRVGSIPDTQRRRRNAAIETYSTVAYAP